MSREARESSLPVLDTNKDLVLPAPMQIVIDDVGWFYGFDDRKIGGPSRTGLKRHHHIQDYMAIEQIGKALDQKINCAFVLGEWDMDDSLDRRIKNMSHFKGNWHNAEHRDPKEIKAIAEYVEASKYIEVGLHGIYHGYYIDNIDNVDTSDYYYAKNKILYSVPEEEVRNRLDIWFEILRNNGITKKVRSFIPPSSAYVADELCSILKEYGIIYVSCRFLTIRWNRRLPQKWCYVEDGVITTQRGFNPIPWDKEDPDFDSIEGENFGIFGSHWPNYLHIDPERDHEVADRAIGYFKKRGETYGTVISRDIAMCNNQYLYIKFAKVTNTETGADIDLTAVPEAIGKLDHFFVSTKKPLKSSENCTFELYETKVGHFTYKVTPQKDTIKLTF